MKHGMSYQPLRSLIAFYEYLVMCKCLRFQEVVDCVYDVLYSATVSIMIARSLLDHEAC